MLGQAGLVLGLVVLAIVLYAACIVLIAVLRWHRHGRKFWASCLYEGRVKHFRWEASKHGFSYPIFFVYVDLDEVDQLQLALWPLFGFDVLSAATLKSTDHLKHDSKFGDSLSERIRAHVERDIGIRPSGPIRLLTHLQYLGYCFNPVSFYYVFDANDTRVEGIVAEVSNTPWIEMYCYTLHPENKAVQSSFNPNTASWSFNFRKNFHVSPFMQMDYMYSWIFGFPSKELTVTTNMLKTNQLHFSATVHLRRVELTPWSLARVLVFYPFQTVIIQVYIHYEAFRLWLKSVPIFPHPNGTETTMSKLVWFFMKPLFQLQTLLQRSTARPHKE